MVNWAGLIRWAIVFHLFGVIIWIGNLLAQAKRAQPDNRSDGETGKNNSSFHLLLEFGSPAKFLQTLGGQQQRFILLAETETHLL